MSKNNDRALSEIWHAPVKERDAEQTQAEIDAAYADREAQLAEHDGWAR